MLSALQVRSHWKSSWMGLRGVRGCRTSCDLISIPADGFRDTWATGNSSRTPKTPDDIQYIFKTNMPNGKKPECEALGEMKMPPQAVWEDSSCLHCGSVYGQRCRDNECFVRVLELDTFSVSKQAILTCFKIKPKVLYIFLLILCFVLLVFFCEFKSHCKLSCTL